jgi:hypothetical protein
MFSAVFPTHEIHFPPRILLIEIDVALPLFVDDRAEKTKAAYWSIGPT